VGGGAGYNHLNSRYTVDNPSGNTPDNIKVLDALKNLVYLMNSIDFPHMQPDKQLIVPFSLSEYVFWRAISKPGKQYALYMHHSILEYSAYTVNPGNYKTAMELNIPSGIYKFDWIDPATGKIIRSEIIQNNSGSIKVTAPEHKIDIALRINSLK
jgi:hypothetical protein